MNYKEKYLKYKLKYLNLRNKFSGGMEDGSVEDEMLASSNIEVPRLQINRQIEGVVTNIGELEFINNQFQFNTITRTINMTTRLEGVNPHLVPSPYTHYALTHVVNLGKKHFYKKYGKFIAEDKYKYFQDLLRISKTIPNYLLIEYYYFNNHTSIESLLIDISKLYKSYTYENGDITDKGIEFLRIQCGFVTNEIDHKIDDFKYLINIAKIHLQHVIDTLKFLRNKSEVELNYSSAIEYFKVTLTDFLKIGFINKFLEIDRGVYEATLESYNMLVTETGIKVLRASGVQMIHGLDMDHFINYKVQFFWEANGIPGTPRIVI